MEETRIKQLHQDRANEIKWKESIKGTLFHFDYQVDTDGIVNL